MRCVSSRSWTTRRHGCSKGGCTGPSPGLADAPMSLRCAPERRACRLRLSSRCAGRSSTTSSGCGAAIVLQAVLFVTTSSLPSGCAGRKPSPLQLAPASASGLCFKLAPRRPPLCHVVRLGHGRSTAHARPLATPGRAWQRGWQPRARSRAIVRTSLKRRSAANPRAFAELAG